MWIKDIKNVRVGMLIDVCYWEEFDQCCVLGLVNILWDFYFYYLDELMEYFKLFVFFCEEGYCFGLVVLFLQIFGFEEIYNGGSWLDVFYEFEVDVLMVV